MKTKTWYVKQHSFSRGDEWSRKIKMDFPENEHLLIIAAVLVHAAYFNKEYALKEYEEYAKWHAANPSIELAELSSSKFSKMLDKKEVPCPFFLGEVAFLKPVKKTETGIALSGEEWYAGISQKPDEATNLCDLAGREDDEEGEW